MLFSSLSFLYLFLPLVLLLYYLPVWFAFLFQHGKRRSIGNWKEKEKTAAKTLNIMQGRKEEEEKEGNESFRGFFRYGNGILFLSSLFFYTWGEPGHLFLLLVQIAAGFAAGLLIEKYRGRRIGTFVFGAFVVLELAVLFYYKYAGFFLNVLEKTTGFSFAFPEILLPAGISFYTFQLMSYEIDVFRGKNPAQKSFLALGAYISMFPQLIAGPIVRYSQIVLQLSGRSLSFTKAASGVRRFLVGLGKKVLFSNGLGELAIRMHEVKEPTVLSLWMYAIAFMLHVYYDFSGYSDMAVGLGRIFGFEFMENFQYPYLSKSITEFWRRWHISLGQWFRDYVYIPLGGNRVSTAKWVRNVLVVFGLTGLWHGASWNFILWGLYFGVVLLLEKIIFCKAAKWQRVRQCMCTGSKRKEKDGTFILGFVKNFLSHAYVLFAVLVGFVLFDADSVLKALADIGGLLGAGARHGAGRIELYYLKSCCFFLLLAIAGTTPLPVKIWKKCNSSVLLGRYFAPLEPAFCLLLLLVVTGYLVAGSFQPFLYFRF